MTGYGRPRHRPRRHCCRLLRAGCAAAAAAAAAAVAASAAAAASAVASVSANTPSNEALLTCVFGTTTVAGSITGKFASILSAPPAA